VGSTPVRAHDVVVDLGAGEGALAASPARIGARVLAVELHPVRATELRRRFAGTRVAVVEVDLVASAGPDIRSASWRTRHQSTPGRRESGDSVWSPPGSGWFHGLSLDGCTPGREVSM